MCKIRELDDSYFSQIKTMFRDVFSSPPWNDDWNDFVQLHEYICDLTQRRGSLVFGFFIDGKLFMKGIEDSLKKKNICTIYLQTEHGIPAYSFYKKTGFTELENCAMFLKVLE